VSCLTSWQWTTSGSNIYYNSGNVGIATTTPTTALTVGGTITAPALTGLSAPINPTDAANKAYVDAAGGGSGGGGSGLNYCQVTNATYTGNLGGISGANAKCAAEFGGGWTMATIPKLIGYFVQSGPIFTTNNNFANSMSYVYGSEQGSATWIDTTGAIERTANNNCFKWTTDADNRSVGAIGYVSYSSSFYSYYARDYQSCSILRRILCCNFWAPDHDIIAMASLNVVDTLSTLDKSMSYLTRRFGKRPVIIAVLAIIAIIVCCVLWFTLSREPSCHTTSYEVRGSSVGQSAPSGSTVTVGDVACTPITRGALVVFTTSADRNAPVIKHAVGLPGDTFAVSDDGAVDINHVETTVPSGKPYRLTRHGVTMLSLYTNDYHGVIPPNSYLLLGDDPAGDLDSSRLGLISLSMIVGVVTSVKQ
jgi:signal peptidase I